MKIAVFLIMITSLVFSKDFTKKELQDIVTYQQISVNKYIANYHSFWKEVCETYLESATKSNDIVIRIQKGLKIKNLCEYVENYSKVKYSIFAQECYMKKVRFFKCVKKKNVFFDALNMELK